MSIKTFADQYNQFQHQFGQDVEQNYQEIIVSLFSPEFQKISPAISLNTAMQIFIPVPVLTTKFGKLQPFPA